MICKTQGIVLRSMKYQDNNLITTLYTRDYGLRSFIVRGFQSSRSRRSHSYFQPLSIIDIVYYEREGRELQKLTESKSAVMLHSLQADPVKMALGLTMVEIFFDTVKEEDPNPQLYALLQRCLLTVESSDRRLIHIFIWFLFHLTRHLGFFPYDRSNNSSYVHFVVREGVFNRATAQTEPVSKLLRRFYYATLENCQEITFDTEEKRNILKTLFAYYEAHVQGFRYPQTLRVFAEVFG